MKRIPSPELLDTDAGTPTEIAASLADLGRINRYFGGISTTGDLIRRATAKQNSKTFKLLEVAAGAGDVPRLAARRLRKDGLQIEFTLLDRAASHLDHRDCPDATTLAADATALPFKDESFDLVACNLFVHHLTPAQISPFVNEALRVCRIAVLINDLVRHRLHLTFVYAGMPLFRSRITRHDAPASVRQAYTVTEMRQLLAQSNAAQVEIHRHYLFRMGVVAWKR
jgi:ubiquinone/menaquinone biosynthesis C-methylase UbiE